VTGALALAAASTGLAYWTTVGSGSTSASTGTVQTITLGAATPTSGIYPGGQGDVALTVSNPNPFQVRIGSLSLNSSQGSGGFGVDAGHSGCGTGALGFTTQTNGGAGWTVPPKVGSTNGSLAIDLSGALTMTTAAAAACQGASFDVFLAAGA
jgi:hypothetical protein